MARQKIQHGNQHPAIAQTGPQGIRGQAGQIQQAAGAGIIRKNPAQSFKGNGLGIHNRGFGVTKNCQNLSASIEGGKAYHV